MSQGDLDVSVSETESEFEYINKESEELIKAEKTDSCGKVVELQDLVAEVMEIEKEINAEASNIVEFSSKNISDQPLFLQPMEDDNDLEIKEWLTLNDPILTIGRRGWLNINPMPVGEGMGGDIDQ